MVDPHRAMLDAFGEKFSEMLDMRRRVEAGEEIPDAELRALASRFPGALRELEMTPTAELESRKRACAAEHGPQAPLWVRVQAQYHALWSAAIALKSAARPDMAQRNEGAAMTALRNRIADAEGRTGLNTWILAHAGAPFGWSLARVRSLFDGTAEVAAEVGEDPWARTLGLCGQCRHRTTTRSARGSEFHLCARSKSDPQWSKYPRLPQIGCAGFDGSDA